MLTVNQLEQEIRALETQQDIVTRLIKQIRLEPAWQPEMSRTPIEETERLTFEWKFEAIAHGSLNLNASIEKFRENNRIMPFDEEDALNQEMFEGVRFILQTMSDAFTQSEQEFQALLDSLRHQREYIPPNAN